MGLDNLITAKGIKEVPWFVKTFNNSDDSIDVCYWRKCWNIRNAIVNKLHIPQDGYCYDLDSEDLIAIAKILIKFSSREYWEQEDDSIWSYEEMKDNINQHIINVIWLATYKENNPEVIIQFIDSY